MYISTVFAYGTVPVPYRICFLCLEKGWWQWKATHSKSIFFGGMAFKTIAMIFHCEHIFYCSQKNISVEVGGSDKYFDAATTKAKIWRGIFAVWGFSACKRLWCGAKAASTIASGRNKFWKRSESLGDGASGGDAGGGGGDVADVYGDGARDIRLSKKTARGLDDKCMMLPLNP